MTEIKEQIHTTEKNNSGRLLDKCIMFLHEIGIETKFEKLDEACFLPGLSIRNGTIIIDREALSYPGDILHEAGHIAVVPAAERSALNATAIEKRPMRESEEMMAIAWSYAACLHLQIDPYFVFHDDGYKGGGSYIADCFNQKQYFGLPMLQWMGMTLDDKNGALQNLPPYPCMLKWMLD